VSQFFFGTQCVPVSVQLSGRIQFATAPHMSCGKFNNLYSCLESACVFRHTCVQQTCSKFWKTDNDDDTIMMVMM